MRSCAAPTKWHSVTTGVYLGGYPSAQFALNRAYAYQLSFLGATNDLDVSGDTYTLWYDRSIGYGITYVLFPYFKPWSSNRYTLDFIVYDCWWHAFFDGIHHPQGFTVNYWWRDTPKLPTLTIVDPGSSAAEAFSPLPSQPPTYWFPPVYT